MLPAKMLLDAARCSQVLANAARYSQMPLDDPGCCQTLADATNTNTNATANANTHANTNANGNHNAHTNSST